MRIINYIVISVLLCACARQDDTSSLMPLPAQPFETDQNGFDSAFHLVGQQWELYRYMPHGSTIAFETSDTIRFIGEQDMTYDNYTTQYAFYSTPTNYVLNIYESPWGMISANLTSFQLESGEINAAVFSILIPGGAPPHITLWMRKLE